MRMLDHRSHLLHEDNVFRLNGLERATPAATPLHILSEPHDVPVHLGQHTLNACEALVISKVSGTNLTIATDHPIRGEEFQ